MAENGGSSRGCEESGLRAPRNDAIPLNPQSFRRFLPSLPRHGYAGGYVAQTHDGTLWGRLARRRQLAPQGIHLCLHLIHPSFDLAAHRLILQIGLHPGQPISDASQRRVGLSHPIQGVTQRNEFVGGQQQGIMSETFLPAGHRGSCCHWGASRSSAS